jgi:hypothetical protein
LTIVPESSNEYHLRVSLNSPLTREIKENDLAATISLPRHKNTLSTRYATNARQRLHPISVAPIAQRLSLERTVPILPAYNAS